MKRPFRILLTGLKWIILALLGVEILCCLAITLVNVTIYGQPWEGTRAYYDAYAIFLKVEGIEHTVHNPPEDSPVATGRPPRRVWLLGGSPMRGG